MIGKHKHVEEGQPDRNEELSVQLYILVLAGIEFCDYARGCNGEHPLHHSQHVDSKKAGILDQKYSA